MEEKVLYLKSAVVFLVTLLIVSWWSHNIGAGLSAALFIWIGYMVIVGDSKMKKEQ